MLVKEPIGCANRFQLTRSLGFVEPEPEPEPELDSQPTELFVRPTGFELGQKERLESKWARKQLMDSLSLSAEKLVSINLKCISAGEQAAR